MLQPDDLKDLAFKGISPSAIEEQLERFRKGFPYLRISDVATVDNHGILRLDLTQEKYYEAEWEDFLSRGGEVEKFVRPQEQPVVCLRIFLPLCLQDRKLRQMIS